jgi:hypothetical protein
MLDVGKVPHRVVSYAEMHWLSSTSAASDLLRQSAQRGE